MSTCHWLSLNLVPDCSFCLWESRVMEWLKKNRTQQTEHTAGLIFLSVLEMLTDKPMGQLGKNWDLHQKCTCQVVADFFFSCSGIKLTCFDWWIMSKDCPVCSVWNTSFYLCVLEHSVLSSEHFFGKSVLEVTVKHKSFRVQSCSSSPNRDYTTESSWEQ